MNFTADYLFLGRPQVKDLVHDFDALMSLNDQLRKPINLQKYLNTLTDLRKELDARVEKVYSHVSLLRKNENKQLNSRRCVKEMSFMNYSPGDWVLVSRSLTKKASNKLKLRWTSPWQVMLLVSFNVYHVRALTGEITTVHASRLWFHEPSGFVPDSTLTEFLIRERGPMEVAETKALRRVKGGDFELLISWLGLGETNDSWEDLRSIYADIPALTNEFLGNCSDTTLAQHARQQL